jgi:hypothetical protein
MKKRRGLGQQMKITLHFPITRPGVFVIRLNVSAISGNTINEETRGLGATNENHPPFSNHSPRCFRNTVKYFRCSGKKRSMKKRRRRTERESKQVGATYENHPPFSNHSPRVFVIRSNISALAEKKDQ